LVCSCNYEGTTQDKQSRELTIVYTSWSESIALTYLAAVLLEEKLEYDVTLKLINVEQAYAEVANGSADVFADAWLPQTQKIYYSQYADSLEKIGISYPDARVGFVVPEYSKLQSIQDLQLWSGEIVGIDDGAGVMIHAREFLERSSFPSKLRSLSETEMTARLEEAIKRREEIVVTGWQPHWVFAKFDLRFLIDNENVFGDKENIYTIAHIGFSNKQPAATRFFERMQLSEKQLNQLVFEIHKNSDAYEGVRSWIRKNEYVVNQWVKNLSPDRTKIM
jgi:glycine betaine/proline transport system substrate-binding protein